MPIFKEIISTIFFYIVIWVGAGFVVSGVEELSHKLKISAFATSFFILGLLTSIPETSVGINSLIDNTPQIFVGNLIGASFVLFMIVIPLLAVLGNGVKLAHNLSKRNLLIALLVIGAPAVFAVDGKLVVLEGVMMIGLYGVLFYFIEKKTDLKEMKKDIQRTNKTHIVLDIFKILLGSVSIFIASKIIVDNTIYFAKLTQMSPYLISLIALSLGTNLPEISLAIRSLVLKKKEVALGDYIGSAAANTLIFGIMTILTRNDILILDHSTITFLLMFIGLALFYYFSRSKNDISVKEGLALMLVYVFFIVLEYGSK